MLHTTRFASTLALALLTGCGGAGFGGSNGTATAPQKDRPASAQSLSGTQSGTGDATSATPTPASGSATTTSKTAQPVSAQTLTELQGLPGGDALGSCLSKWGGGSNAPTADQLLGFRTLSRDAGDASDVEVQDQDNGRAEVVLVHVSAGAASDLSIKLGNPKSWYCLDATADAASAISVKVDCHAHYAESIQAGEASDIRETQTGC